MDGRTDQTGSAQKAGGLYGENRLSRQMARLLIAQDRPRSVRLERNSRGKLRKQSRVSENRQTGRSHRMGHDAANCECVLQSEYERDCFPGRYFAAAIFLRQG